MKRLRRPLAVPPALRDARPPNSDLFAVVHETVLISPEHLEEFHSDWIALDATLRDAGDPWGLARPDIDRIATAIEHWDARRRYRFWHAMHPLLNVLRAHGLISEAQWQDRFVQCASYWTVVARLLGSPICVVDRTNESKALRV